MTELIALFLSLKYPKLKPAGLINLYILFYVLDKVININE